MEKISRYKRGQVTYKARIQGVDTYIALVFLTFGILNIKCIYVRKMPVHIPLSSPFESKLHVIFAVTVRLLQ